MSFTYAYSPEDAQSSLWLCVCQECHHEFEREIEPDLDEETGRIIFHKPSECPVCFSSQILVETN